MQMKMQINRSSMVFVLPFILVLVSLGCNLSGILPGGTSDNVSEATPTRTPMPTFTPTPVGGAFVDVPVETPPETETQEQPIDDAVEQQEVVVEPTQPPPPTDTPQPTATPIPAITILQNMNIRGGPGTNYPVVGAGAPGDTANILGKNDDGSWFQIGVPNVAGGVAWIYGPLVQAEGSLETVAVAQAPLQSIPQRHGLVGDPGDRLCQIRFASDFDGTPYARTNRSSGSDGGSDQSLSIYTRWLLGY